MSLMEAVAIDWKDQILKILAKVSSRREAEDFKHPVPWQELGLDDYPEIVEKPMDLGTVTSNIANNVYSSKEECVADIRLIWSNSLMYNAPGSRIYTSTKSLSEQFEYLWAQIIGDDISRPPSKDELRQWINECHYLSQQDLGKIIKWLEQNCPKALVLRQSNNQVDVNADLIPGKSFRKVAQMTRKIYETGVSSPEKSSSSTSQSSGTLKRKSDAF